MSQNPNCFQSKRPNRLICGKSHTKSRSLAVGQFFLVFGRSKSWCSRVLVLVVFWCFGAGVVLVLYCLGILASWCFGVLVFWCWWCSGVSGVMALAFSCFACCGVLMFGVLVFWSSGVALLLLLLLLRLRRPSPSLLLSMSIFISFLTCLFITRVYSVCIYICAFTHTCFFL